ncbi:MAG TPA: hypothetical protein VFN37_06810 [Candidatus Baltobacteraceae bacterium]|nr:hypothetical protein [Candidatus Baltobacteraceae bacterium]
MSIAAFILTAIFAAAPAAAQVQSTPATASPLPAKPASVKGTPPPKPAKPTPTPSPTPTPGPPWSNMPWREIGPALPGGRVAAVAGSDTDPNLYYIGSAGGGVWKSQDGGETWQAVFEKEKVAAIGAVAIDPKNNDVVWVGTGESNPRNDVTYGDGVYKSTDGGKTFKNLGLAGTRHISRIAIDPKDPNHVVVGALGDVFGPSHDRGVYVTWDGGKTWSQTLFVSDQSGASDIAMDPSDPNVVYAGIWHFKRQPWTFTSGGPDDGLYKSTDGGKTWTKLTGHGLPTGITGRIGLAIAPSNGKRVYALIESNQGILWRSDDAGANWTMVSNDTLVDQRPFYFSHIAVDPKDENKVYAVSMMLAESTDGGKKFKAIARPVHVDYHAIWIANNDPKRIIVGEDGGIARTVDAGGHWFFDRNIPIGEVYHIAYSNENPYWVCGGWQDNSGWCGPNNSLDPSGLLNKYWVSATGGDGEWVVPDPIDPNWLWADSENGVVTVFNKKTHDFIFAMPYIERSLGNYNLSLAKFRFNWDSPIAFAPWDGHVAWVGGNVIFQSTDRGIHWKVLTPDLTLNMKSHQQPSGGPITHDVSGAEYTDTIIYIEGSTLRKGEIWVGTDDGLVQLSRDGGKHWKNVTPPGVPPYGRVETVTPSAISDGTAFANIDRHRLGDFKPYLFVTHDFGKHWTSIVNNLPQTQYVRSVRQDSHDARIVYAGTEAGMWISFDGGGSWHDFRNNMPTVSVRDIRIQPKWDDLLIATHGRSLYVMDDIRALRMLPNGAGRPFVLAPRTAYEYNLHSDDEGTYTDYAGQNPPYGAIITYYLPQEIKPAPQIEILDASRHVIRTVKGTHKVHGKQVPWASNKVGINRYVWDFQIDGPVKWYGAAKESYQGPNEGPGVPPGRYYVRMTVAGKTYVEPFTVRPDPQTHFTQAQFERSYAFGKKYTRQFSVIDSMLNGLDSVKKELNAAKSNAKTKNNAALQKQIDAALAARETLFHELTADYHNDEDSIQRPGALREDYQGLGFFGLGIITPAVENYAGRVEAAYRALVPRYNAYARSLGAIEAALKSAGLKTPSVPEVKP